MLAKWSQAHTPVLGIIDTWVLLLGQYIRCWWKETNFFVFQVTLAKPITVLIMVLADQDYAHVTVCGGHPSPRLVFQWHLINGDTEHFWHYNIGQILTRLNFIHIKIIHLGQKRYLFCILLSLFCTFTTGVPALRPNCRVNIKGALMPMWDFYTCFLNILQLTRGAGSARSVGQLKNEKHTQ